LKNYESICDRQYQSKDYLLEMKSSEHLYLRIHTNPKIGHFMEEQLITVMKNENVEDSIDLDLEPD
jgi:hypothetical protein